MTVVAPVTERDHSSGTPTLQPVGAAPRRMSKVQRVLFAAAFALVLAAAAVTWIKVVERLRAPEPVAVSGTPAAIVWAGRVFSSETELAAWFRRRGIKYSRWAESHPAAVRILRLRERPGAPRPSGTEAARRSAAAADQVERKATQAESPGAGRQLATPFLIALGIGATALLLALVVGAVASAARTPLTRLRRSRPRLRAPVGRRARATASVINEHMGRVRPLASAVRPRRTAAPAAGPPPQAERVANDVVHAATPRPRPTNAGKRSPKAPAQSPHAEPSKAQRRQAEVPTRPLPTFLESGSTLQEPHAPAASAVDTAKAKAPTRSAPAETKAAPVPEPALEQEVATPATRTRKRRSAESPAVPREQDTRPDPPVRPLPAVTEPAPTPRPVAEPTRSPGCEIRWWRGYVSSQFWAVMTGEDGAEVTIAASPYFRWRKGETPPEIPPVANALRVLVESLEHDGWTVAGRGDAWFAFRLLHPSGPDGIPVSGG